MPSRKQATNDATNDVTMTTAKVSKTKQRQLRKEARAQKATTELNEIQQRQIAAAINRTKALLRAIATEAAAKGLLFYERIESAKETARIRKEKAEETARQAKEKKEQYFAKLDEYLSFLPKDAERKHENYCNCEECCNTPSPRKYILAIKKNYSNKEVYIFLLPESFEIRSDNDLVELAIQHKYQLFEFPYYAGQTKDTIRDIIHYGDKYQIIGLDEQKGKVKTFDTYLNPEFWSGVNGCFTIPLKDQIKKYFTDSYFQKFSFRSEFYHCHTTADDDEYCFHVKSEDCEYSCPYAYHDNQCPYLPMRYSIFEPDKKTSGKICIPFEVTTNCCENNQKRCVLVCVISYKKGKIGITIENRKDATFYALSELDKIDFSKIEGDLFKLETECKKCEIQRKKETAILEVAKSFDMSPENCKIKTDKIVTKSVNPSLIGDVNFPFHYITNTCSNKCSHDGKTYNVDGKHFRYKDCSECFEVLNSLNSSDVLNVNCKEFTVYKFPDQSKNYTQFVPNYLFEYTPFSRRDVEMHYLITVCLGKLPFELIKYMFKFLSPEDLDSYNKRQLIQLDSLVEESNNLTLAKSIFRNKKLYEKDKAFYLQLTKSF
jgi:hypothetical protein